MLRLQSGVPIALLAPILLATACAARAVLCDGAQGCPAKFDCVAGLCLANEATMPYVATRRLLLAPADMALLGPSPAPAGSLPQVLTLGREGGASSLLLRFDLPLEKGTTIVRASILLERSSAAGQLAPVSLYAERVTSPWSGRTTTRSTGPALQDLRLPLTRVDPSGPRLVRVDVTSLARLWLAHDPRDHGVLLVAADSTPTGASFALYGDVSQADPDPLAERRTEHAQPPRLELYVK
jgi:hypothetical protein